MTLDPALIERRLERLIGPACRGDEHDIGWIPSFAMSIGDAMVFEQALEEELVYLARYMRQSIRVLEEQPITRLRGWVEIVSKFIRAESGVKEASAEQLETEYT